MRMEKNDDRRLRGQLFSNIRKSRLVEGINNDPGKNMVILPAITHRFSLSRTRSFSFFRGLYSAVFPCSKSCSASLGSFLPQKKNSFCTYAKNKFSKMQ